MTGPPGLYSQRIDLKPSHEPWINPPKSNVSRSSPAPAVDLARLTPLHLPGVGQWSEKEPHDPATWTHTH